MMKIKYVTPSIALLLFTSIAGQANASVFGNPYMGVSLAWDHMGGKSYGSLKNFMGNTVTFTDGRHLSSNRVNGYFFVGTSYDLPSFPLFISPEFQIGQGSVKSQLRGTNVNDLDMGQGVNRYAQRSLEPKLSRELNTSFVLRVGSKIMESGRLYGLVGIDVSHFKYIYTFEEADTAAQEIISAPRFTKKKWKTAPTFGIGIEKDVAKVRVGLEGRIALYGPIKTFRARVVGGDTESVSTKIKPYVSSLMLRLSYALN
ncbi:MAG: hypothetical protein K0M45_07610 [Candidatus Paracaedibacteraceae bacterium]|nr:hypothetical protein [Candidatus Paracaedibacteraceae bacterium]